MVKVKHIILTVRRAPFEVRIYRCLSLQPASDKVIIILTLNALRQVAINELCKLHPRLLINVIKISFIHFVLTNILVVQMASCVFTQSLRSAIIMLINN